MSPKLILSYFDIPALGEPLRLALAMTGLPWEDKRVSKEEFMAMKPSESTAKAVVYRAQQSTAVARWVRVYGSFHVALAYAIYLPIVNGSWMGIYIYIYILQYVLCVSRS